MTESGHNPVGQQGSLTATLDAIHLNQRRRSELFKQIRQPGYLEHGDLITLLDVIQAEEKVGLGTFAANYGYWLQQLWAASRPLILVVVALFVISC